MRSSLSHPLEKALCTYAVAGSATLATICAMPAQAAIHHTTVNLSGTIAGPFIGSPVPIDVNSDGVVDFVLQGTFFIVSDRSGDLMLTLGYGQNGVAANGGAQALHFGQVIGPNLAFASAYQGLVMAGAKTSFGFTFSSGQFMNQTNKFLGLRLNLNGKIHYGWARLTVQKCGGTCISYQLLDYAYQDRPGIPILAGQGIGRSASNEGTPFALGALALGHSGLDLFRDRNVATGF